MKTYTCKIGDGFMCEDELPEDLPSEFYDWWFNNSHVDGVRVGPIIKGASQTSDPADARCGHAYCNLHKSNVGCEEHGCKDRTRLI